MRDHDILLDTSTLLGFRLVEAGGQAAIGAKLGGKSGGDPDPTDPKDPPFPDC